MQYANMRVHAIMQALHGIMDAQQRRCMYYGSEGVMGPHVTFTVALKISK